MNRRLLGAGAALGTIMLGRGALRMADGGAPLLLAAATGAAGVILLVLVFTAYYRQPKRNGIDRSGRAGRARRARRRGPGEAGSNSPNEGSPDS